MHRITSSWWIELNPYFYDAFHFKVLFIWYYDSCINFINVVFIYCYFHSFTFNLSAFSLSYLKLIDRTYLFFIYHCIFSTKHDCCHLLGKEYMFTDDFIIKLYWGMIWVNLVYARNWRETKNSPSNTVNKYLLSISFMRGTYFKSVFIFYYHKMIYLSCDLSLHIFKFIPELADNLLGKKLHNITLQSNIYIYSRYISVRLLVSSKLLVKFSGRQKLYMDFSIAWFC